MSKIVFSVEFLKHVFLHYLVWLFRNIFCRLTNKMYSAPAVRRMARELRAVARVASASSRTSSVAVVLTNKRHQSTAVKTASAVDDKHFLIQFSNREDLAAIR